MALIAAGLAVSASCRTARQESLHCGGSNGRAVTNISLRQLDFAAALKQGAVHVEGIGGMTTNHRCILLPRRQA